MQLDIMMNSCRRPKGSCPVIVTRRRHTVAGNRERVQGTARQRTWGWNNIEIGLKDGLVVRTYAAYSNETGVKAVEAIVESEGDRVRKMRPRDSHHGEAGGSVGGDREQGGLAIGTYAEYSNETGVKAVEGDG